jgi:DNA oxidative demethylase
MDLFFDELEKQVKLAEGAVWLRGFALPEADALWALVSAQLAIHPPQQMMTPMGYPMSVKTTSVGDYGWVGSASGYGYAKINPVTNQPWPSMPKAFMALAQRAAGVAGYSNFCPDTCLINLYETGAKMGLHQDKDELDFTQPIVSVSLGVPAIFLFGGAKRADKTAKLVLTHGDVVVWGGASRRYFHGVNTVKLAQHPLLGALRCNLTFRKAR